MKYQANGTHFLVAGQRGWVSENPHAYVEHVSGHAALHANGSPLTGRAEVKEGEFAVVMTHPTTGCHASVLRLTVGSD